MIETERAAAIDEPGPVVAIPHEPAQLAAARLRIVRHPRQEILLRTQSRGAREARRPRRSPDRPPARGCPAHPGEQADHPPLLSPDVGDAPSASRPGARRSPARRLPGMPSSCTRPARPCWGLIVFVVASRTIGSSRKTSMPSGLPLTSMTTYSLLPSNDPPPRRPSRSPTRSRSGVARLRAGDPAARLSTRANLTITNLGGSGVESFAAVINPPESAILAVGKIMPVVTIVDGQVAVQSRVNLTLSADHRIVSGKYAARFLRAIVQRAGITLADEEANRNDASEHAGQRRGCLMSSISTIAASSLASTSAWS